MIKSVLCAELGRADGAGRQHSRCWWYCGGLQPEPAANASLNQRSLLRAQDISQAGDSCSWAVSVTPAHHPCLFFGFLGFGNCMGGACQLSLWAAHPPPSVFAATPLGGIGRSEWLGLACMPIQFESIFFWQRPFLQQGNKGRKVNEGPPTGHPLSYFLRCFQGELCLDLASFTTMDGFGKNGHLGIPFSNKGASRNVGLYLG